MYKGKRWHWVVLISVLTIMILAGWDKQVQSQEKYPTRAIEILCPWSPGGGSDAVARLTAHFLKKKWGVSVSVSNPTGGLGVPATMQVHNAPPDGYTILLDIDSTTYLLKVAVEDAPVDVMARTFLSTVTFAPFVFMVPAASPYKTLADLMTDAKRDPENFNYAAGGINQVAVFRQLFTTFGFEDFRRAKIVMTKGGAESTVLIAGNHVKVGTTTPITCRAAVKAGTVKLLAITYARDPDYPDVPTAAELGYPSINYVHWVGFSGPPKLPPYIVKAWEDACQEMLKDPETISRLKTMGIYPFYKNSVELRQYGSEKMVEAKKWFGLK